MINPSLYKSMPFDSQKDLQPITNVLRVPLVLAVHPSAPMLTDVIGGYVPMVFDSTIAIPPHLAGGKLRPIAVTGAKRSAQFPDVPTFAEAGLPGVEAYAWYGLFARAGTPKPIVDKLNAEARKAMKTPEFQKVLMDTGSEDVGDTPENFGKFVQAEAAKWGKVVKASGATVD